MLWYRSLFAVCLMLCLSACGFMPMYGAAAHVERPDIEIANIPDRDGQYLRNQLIDQLNTAGRPADAPYILSLAPLTKTIVNIGIQKDATATRAQMQFTTHMKLTERATGKIMLERDLKTVGAYNLLDNQFATLVSQQNITESTLREMADSAVTELDLYFRRAGGA